MEPNKILLHITLICKGVYFYVDFKIISVQQKFTVIKANVYVIYINYQQQGTEMRTLWHT